MDKSFIFYPLEDMAKNRKTRTAKEKFQIVLELLRGRKTQAQITTEYGVHSTQQKAWKDQFLEQGETVFEKKKKDKEKKHKKEIENLNKVVGQYAVEVDWLKKKLTECSSYAQRVQMIEPPSKLTITKQAWLLSVSKSSYYYKHEWTKLELEIMEQIDKIYTEHPYYGTRRISKELQKRGYNVGRKGARKFMGIMGICALYPKPKTSISNKQHEKFPYLLENVEIKKPDQVRSTDITYIKVEGGFVYLVAIMDRYGRYIVAWDIGTVMDKELCTGILKEALSKEKPEIFNTDQGSQFTSKEFTNILKDHEVKISMDGKGSYYDNIRVERLWRTIKYEDIHINEYKTPEDVYHGLSLYIKKYNTSRLHSSIGYRTPIEAYND